MGSSPTNRTSVFAGNLIGGGGTTTISSFEKNGVTYTIMSETDKTVLAFVESEQEKSNVPATVEWNGTTYNVSPENINVNTFEINGIDYEIISKTNKTAGAYVKSEEERGNVLTTVPFKGTNYSVSPEDIHVDTFVKDGISYIVVSTTEKIVKARVNSEHRRINVPTTVVWDDVIYNVDTRNTQVVTSGPESVEISTDRRDIANFRMPTVTSGAEALEILNQRLESFQDHTDSNVVFMDFDVFDIKNIRAYKRINDFGHTCIIIKEKELDKFKVAIRNYLYNKLTENCERNKTGFSLMLGVASFGFDSITANRIISKIENPQKNIDDIEELSRYQCGLWNKAKSTTMSVGHLLLPWNYVVDLYGTVFHDYSAREWALEGCSGKELENLMDEYQFFKKEAEFYKNIINICRTEDSIEINYGKDPKKYLLKLFCTSDIDEITTSSAPHDDVKDPIIKAQNAMKAVKDSFDHRTDPAKAINALEIVRENYGRIIAADSRNSLVRVSRENTRKILIGEFGSQLIINLGEQERKDMAIMLSLLITKESLYQILHGPYSNPEIQIYAAIHIRPNILHRDNGITTCILDLDKAQDLKKKIIEWLKREAASEQLMLYDSDDSKFDSKFVEDYSLKLEEDKKEKEETLEKAKDKTVKTVRTIVEGDTTTETSATETATSIVSLFNLPVTMINNIARLTVSQGIDAILDLIDLQSKHKLSTESTQKFDQYKRLIKMYNFLIPAPGSVYYCVKLQGNDTQGYNVSFLDLGV